MTTGRVALIVLDGVGIGAAPDAEAYGDVGSDTLGNLARAVGGFDLPYLASLGLGCCRPLAGLSCASPTAAHGVAIPHSPGKDSTTGHWELTGLVLERPFPLYPNGFPDDVIAAFERATGRGTLGNHPASGTAVIERYGAEHLAGGAWIVYTSADSVFQIAAHDAVVPLEELYRAAEQAREILTGPHAVSRVIARPFTGEVGAFVRRSAARRDLSVEPPGPTLLDRLAEAGIPRVGVGKIDDLYAGRHIASEHTPTNADAYRLIEAALMSLERGLIFANVIEFDQSWGHRNDPSGFYQGLQELDERLPALVGLLRTGDLMIVTADHGNDPTTPSTDHSREVVPVLAIGPGVRPVALGDRNFSDIGATIGAYFGVSGMAGSSFLSSLAVGES